MQKWNLYDSKAGKILGMLQNCNKVEINKHKIKRWENIQNICFWEEKQTLLSKLKLLPVHANQMSWKQ